MAAIAPREATGGELQKEIAYGPSRPTLESIRAESARLAGSDALKYDELFPITSRWPSKGQEAYQPHDNWDHFCKGQRQAYLQLDGELQESEGLEEQLRKAETNVEEIGNTMRRYQLEKKVAQDFMTKAERAAAKAGSTSCFCVINKKIAEEKRAAAEEDLRVASANRDAVEKEERTEQARLEGPKAVLLELQERHKAAAAKETDQMAILDSLFTDTSDAAEQVAEDQVARLLQKGAQIEAALAAQKEVLRLLHAALVHFEGGQSRLKGGGESGVGVQLRLHQASALLASSSSAIQKALSTAPFAPGNARLKQEPRGPLASFLGTELPDALRGSDALTAAQKLSGLLESAYEEVLALYQWHDKLVANVVEDLESNAASLVVGKRALLEERLRLVRQISVQRQVTNFERRRSSRVSEGGLEAPTTLDQYASGPEAGRLDW